MPWAGIRGDAGKGILLQGVGRTLPACLLEADRASAGSLPYRHVRGWKDVIFLEGYVFG